MRLFRAALVAAFLLPLSLAAQVYNTPVFNRIGQPIAGASVAVCSAAPPAPPSATNPCNGHNATIYTDYTLATPAASNVVTSDAFGNAVVYGFPGVYWTVTYGYLVTPRTDIIVIPFGATTSFSHNLLSTLHPDTVPYSPPVLGDLVQGNGSGKWQRLQGNTSTTPKWLKSVGNGTATISQSWVQVGNPCDAGKFATVLNPDLTIGCDSAVASTGIALPPPFAVPTGQGVAWAFPTTATAFPTDVGSTTGGYAIAGIPNGIVNMTHSCGLCNNGWVNRWSGFVMPTLPNDAVIQGVYGVQFATRVGNGVAVWNSACNSATFSNNASNPNFNGEFATTSMGATSGIVTGATCQSSLNQSLALDFNDTVTTNAIALAIYYTSATPSAQVGVYFPLSGSSGSGSVTSVSSGNLSPLFNVTVSNSTTTPSLAFAPIAQGAHSFYGNNTGSLAAPDFHALAVGDLPYTYTGNTTKLVTASGSIGTGNCFVGDASGNAVDGGTCGLVPANPNSWDSGTTYAKNTVVLYNGASYYSLVSTLGVTPGSDPTKWALLAAAGVSGTNGTNGTNGSPGAPGYSPNQILSGCGVVWSSGLSFNVSACSYLIQNTQFSAAATSITLATADPSLDRIDVIVANSSGAIAAITGTPSGSPTPPSVDISSQLQLTFVYVAAGATIPSNISVTDIYHENAEWTCTSSANLNCASTNNPHSGTTDIEATTATTGNFARLTIPSSTIDISGKNLVLWVRSKSTWPATRSLTLQWYNGTTAKCTPVTLKDGNFTFNSSTTASYQQIVIPTSTFACAGIPVTRLQVTVAGTGGNIGFYLDDIILQAGVTSSTSTVGLNPKLTWNSTTAYSVNDFVFYNGSSWYALAANINSAPTIVNANWQTVGSSGSVTSIVAGNGLTGGTITTSGTIAVATANKTRTCHIVFGSDDAASDLLTANIQPQHSVCFFDVPATILQITVKAAGGTPNVIVSKNHAGAQTALLSSALATGASGAIACSNTGGTTGIDGTTTCSATLQNTTVAAGDFADTTGGATSSGAKWFSIEVTFTVN